MPPHCDAILSKYLNGQLDAQEAVNAIKLHLLDLYHPGGS